MVKLPPLVSPRWLSTDSHWQNLRALFNPTITRLFISWFAIAPIFLKVVEALPETIALPNNIVLRPSLPFNWWILWGASVGYAFAYMVYMIFCPRFIKNYPNYGVYEELGHSSRWLVWEFYFAWSSISNTGKRELFENAVEKGFVQKNVFEEASRKPAILKSGTCFVFSFEGQRHKIELDENLPASRVKELFWELFGRWSEASFVWRHVAWIVFYAAILTVIWVVGENVFFVAGKLLPSK